MFYWNADRVLEEMLEDGGAAVPSRNYQLVYIDIDQGGDFLQGAQLLPVARLSRHFFSGGFARSARGIPQGSVSEAQILKSKIDHRAVLRYNRVESLQRRASGIDDDDAQTIASWQYEYISSFPFRLASAVLHLPSFASEPQPAMSQSPPLPRSHGSPNRRDRRLSIIQDSALDDLPHDTDTHALDDTSPSPHHESAMMSFMDAHAPDGQSSHKCSRPSPLMSRGNSVVAMEEVKKNGNVAKIFCAGSVLWKFG